MRKKIIAVGGKSLGIRFNVNELEAYGLKEGDFLDISDAFKVEVKQDGTK